MQLDALIGGRYHRETAKSDS